MAQSRARRDAVKHSKPSQIKPFTARRNQRSTPRLTTSRRVCALIHAAIWVSRQRAGCQQIGPVDILKRLIILADLRLNPGF